jgi:putative hydrolase of the HAD superfamily
MTIKAVIFDWGGTLTPWHNVDLMELWLGYANVYDLTEVGAHPRIWLEMLT